MSLNKRLINTGGGGSFDISTLTQVQSVGVGSPYAQGAISPNGEWLIVMGYHYSPIWDNAKWAYRFTTPHDLTTGVKQTVVVDAALSPGRGAYIDSSGTKATLVDGSIHKSYTLSTAGDFSTATNTANISKSSTQDTTYFANNGNSHYVTQYNTSTILQYNSSANPYRVTTTGGTSFALPQVSGNWNTMWGIAFNSDGTKMIINQATEKTIFQYTCSTPYLASSATYDGILFVHNITNAWFLEISDNDAFVYIGKEGAQYKYAF